MQRRLLGASYFTTSILYSPAHRALNFSPTISYPLHINTNNSFAKIEQYYQNMARSDGEVIPVGNLRFKGQIMLVRLDFIPGFCHLENSFIPKQWSEGVFAADLPLYGDRLFKFLE